MDCTIKSAIAELTKCIIARIIHKELLMSTISAFSLLQVVICSDFHLKMADILPLHLNNITTTNSINRWIVRLNPPWLNCQTVLSLNLFIKNCWCPPGFIFGPPGGDLHLILRADILPLNLNSSTTTHPINKWTIPLHLP